MINFKYNNQIDNECWQRLIDAKSKFGMDFPETIEITDNRIEQAKASVNSFQQIWLEVGGDFYSGIKKIYRHNFPDNVNCYINTSDYSMDNFEKNYISVSINRNTAVMLKNTVVHEAGHYMFWKYYGQFASSIGCNERQTEDIKEIITVINNIVFKDIDDRGYKAHQELRGLVLAEWERTKDLKEVIRFLKDKVN